MVPTPLEIFVPVTMCGSHACRYKWGSGCNVKVWFPATFCLKCVATKDSVCCPEFRGSCFSEVKYGIFNPRLDCLRSVFPSWSVRSEKFYSNTNSTLNPHTCTEDDSVGSVSEGNEEANIF